MRLPRLYTAALTKGGTVISECNQSGITLIQLQVIRPFSASVCDFGAAEMNERASDDGKRRESRHQDNSVKRGEPPLDSLLPHGRL